MLLQAAADAIRQISLQRKLSHMYQAIKQGPRMSKRLAVIRYFHWPIFPDGVVVLVEINKLPGRDLVVLPVGAIYERLSEQIN